MVDPATGEFYFLEVNARLQVEHPVTEAITGVDLVQWQIKVASGEALALPDKLLKGDRSAINGHAIEARIISEDPAKGFVPSIGRIVGWAEPQNVRVDTGFGAGSEVTRYYDSLIAKVIAHAPDRATTMARLTDALYDFHVLGVSTNIAYLIDLLAHPGFREGEIDTGFLAREFGDWKPSDEVPDELQLLLEYAAQPNGKALEKPNTTPAWDLADGFRVTS
jgi:acetyl/propionyl-CoA carboxylase alpha subunit